MSQQHEGVSERRQNVRQTNMAADWEHYNTFILNPTAHSQWLR